MFEGFKINFKSDFFRVISGFGGALYVWVHRRYVFFMRSNKVLNKFLQKNRFIYPGILALMVIVEDNFTGKV